MLSKNQVTSAPTKTIETPPPPPPATTTKPPVITTTPTTVAQPTTTDKNTAVKTTTDNKAVVAADQEDLIAVEIQKLDANKASATTKTTATANYIVQLGVFKNHATADQFKAQLVMQGYEAKIKTTKKNLYRVWLGPYPTLAAAKDQQHALEENHIKSRISKEL